MAKPLVGNTLAHGNPYSAPVASSDVGGERPAAVTWLVTTSCWLAVLLRFTPLGGDIAFGFTHEYGTVGYLATSLAFHAAVLVPAAIFAMRNGVRSWSIAPKRVAAIFTITVVALAIDIAISSRG